MMWLKFVIGELTNMNIRQSGSSPVGLIAHSHLDYISAGKFQKAKRLELVQDRQR